MDLCSQMQKVQQAGSKALPYLVRPPTRFMNGAQGTATSFSDRMLCGQCKRMKQIYLRVGVGFQEMCQDQAHLRCADKVGNCAMKKSDPNVPKTDRRSGFTHVLSMDEVPAPTSEGFALMLESGSIARMEGCPQ